MRKLFLIALAIMTGLSSTLTATPASIEHVRTINGIEEYKLSSNGLTILFVPNEELPVATVMVTYKVGSRNEVTGTTGATHILEHMMFKGTERFNSSQDTDYFSQMERIGALSNATTSFDRTNYFATLPSEYVPLAIELEADRMRNLLIRKEELDSEMSVVRNEYERGENNPVLTLVKELYASAFMAHPYGHPTIGWPADIEATSTDKLRAFYDTYYWPENAVLSVIGGFDPEETLASISKFYGTVPSSPQPIPTVETVEPEQLGPRRIEISRTGQVGIVMVGFKVPEGSNEDWPALVLIEQILGANKTGRLYRALEDKGKASATYTYAPQLHDPGLFILAAYMTPEATHEETEDLIVKEIEHLVNGGVTEDELKQAKSVVKANVVYGRDGSYAIASQLNEAIAMGDWTKYVTQPKTIDEVSVEDIQRVAAKYFRRDKRTTGWFVPEFSEQLSEFTQSISGKQYYRDPATYSGSDKDLTTSTSDSEMNIQSEAGGESVVNFSKYFHHAKVGNIDFIAVDMPVDGMVSFIGSFAADETFSPEDSPMLAGLTAAMLDKGTRRSDRFAIAELLNKLGAEVNFAANAHELQFSGRFLREDAGTVINLLAEQLREPAFAPDVLETLKDRQIAQLLLLVDEPDYLANAATSRLLYPNRHPNYSEDITSLIENLKSITVEAIEEFHAAHYGPKSMRLVFAGDIDFEQLTAAVKFAFEGWEGGVNYPDTYPEQLENAQRQERIHIADKTSVAVCYAQNTGLQRTDDDYLPFMVGNYLLGGSFNSLLMQEVRVNQGLTYSIRSTHTGDILTPGNWILNASFSPTFLEQGLSATESVLADWYENGFSEQEVQQAIKTLRGSYLVRLSTTSNVANQILSFMLRGFSPEYIDAYPRQLSSITADQVNRSIRKYYNPKLNVLVIAGSLKDKSEQTANKADQTIDLSVHLDTPDTGWRIEIQAVYQSSESLIAVSQLYYTEENATSVVSAVSDSIELPLTEGLLDTLPVQHYIIGRTWDWDPFPEYNFIDSVGAIEELLNGTKLIYKQ